MTLVIGFWLGVGVGIAAMHWLDMTYQPALDKPEPPRDTAYRFEAIADSTPVTELMADWEINT